MFGLNVFGIKDWLLGCIKVLFGVVLVIFVVCVVVVVVVVVLFIEIYFCKLVGVEG